MAKNDSQKDYAESSDWTESDEIYIGKESVSDGSGKVDYNNPNGAGNQNTAQVGWIQDGNRWWYRYPDGSYPKNTWVSIFGEKYFFDEKGYMVTGWVTWKDKEYYCGDDGVMLVNTVTPDGERVGPDGSRQ